MRISWAPIALMPKARPRAGSWSSRRFSASTITYARYATGWPERATTPWRRPCSIAKLADEKPKVPIEMHFGETDQSIPMSDVEAIRKKRPQAEIYTYPDAGHGFHCDERASYNEKAATTAWPRTVEFLKRYVKK